MNVPLEISAFINPSAITALGKAHCLFLLLLRYQPSAILLGIFTLLLTPVTVIVLNAWAVLVQSRLSVLSQTILVFTMNIMAAVPPDSSLPERDAVGI